MSGERQNREPQIHDLRTFLEALRSKGHLVEISRRVSLVHEMGAVADALIRTGGPAPLFKNVDHPSGIPVTGGLLASIDRIAIALGCEKSEVTGVIGRALKEPSSTVLVDRPPFRENVIVGGTLDSLPIPFHNPGDAGPYITGGIAIARDPDTGRHNYSYNRLQIKGPRKTGFVMNVWRHIRQFYEKAEQRGEALPVAIAIGLDPVIHIAAGLRTDEEEGRIAAALRGEPLEVGKCETVDIEVPAHAEIVIEGRILPGIREEEGPLAEFTGHYGEKWYPPVMEVTAICHRSNPIFQTIIPGSFEHVYLGNVLPREPLLLEFTRHVSKGVKGVHLAPYTGGFMAVVSLEKSNPGEPKNVALAALMTHVNIKMAVVVDPDVDIHSPSDVLWAMTTRVDPSKDIFVVPRAQGIENDPTADKHGVHSKIGIDATLEESKKKDYKRVVYPPVDLKRYLP
ncbi:MAG TPA: UbiD family decarboxylase [Clostridia bacterium]|nr:UbiD family decarboxylase [Clostridia bacterium]